MLKLHLGIKHKIREFVINKLGHRYDDEKVIYQSKSKFRKLTIVENKRNHTRMMFAGNHLFVAGVDTNSGFPINASYFLSDILVSNTKNVLFIGGGPQAVPSYVWRKYKPKQIDIVERDELTTILAKKYFNSPQDKNYCVFHSDINLYLKRVKKKYDIIYSNIGLTRKRGVSKNDLSTYCSLDGIKRLSDILTKNGLLLFIVIAKLEGEDLVFARNCFKRLKNCFKSVYVFSDSKDNRKRTQSIIFLASKNKVSIKDAYKNFILKKKRPHKLEVYEELMARFHEKNILVS